MRCVKKRSFLGFSFVILLALVCVYLTGYPDLESSANLLTLPVSSNDETEDGQQIEEESGDGENVENTEDVVENQPIEEASNDGEINKEELIEGIAQQESSRPKEVSDDETAKDELLEHANDNTAEEDPVEQSIKDLANEDHPPEIKRSKQILIVANFRTGSSFLGDILQSAQGAFYSYEPLYFLDRYPGKKSELLRSIFYCQFPGQYLQYINGVIGGGDGNFMKRNKRAWEACEHNQTLCYQPDFIDNLCSTYPIRVIKVVRLRVKELAKLLEEDPNTKDWKMIYLMRDPRGTMASRAGVGWCGPETKCGEPSNLCGEMMEDMMWIKKLDSTDPEHHYLLKFEDMADDVDLEIEKLFDYLEIPFDNSVRDFLKKHTKAKPKEKKEDEPFSITKDTKAVASSWKSKLSSQKIANIEKVCAPIMKWLGYEL